MSGRYTTDYREDMRRLRTRPQQVIAVLIVIVAIGVPFLFGLDFRPPLNFPWSAWLTSINLALVAVIGAAAFNLLLGYTHQISVAHAAFLMLGSMTAALLGVVWGLPFSLVVITSMVVGALVGAIVALPALRFRGLYLLIATLGVHFVFLFAYRAFLRQFFGFSGVRFEPPTIPWLGFLADDPVRGFEIFGNFRWYWLLLAAAVVSVWFMSNVVRTREGRAFRAIGQHDVAAELIGIDVVRSKVLAFAISSAFVSLAGALQSYYLGARGEESFPFAVVLAFAIMIIVGGYGSMAGSVLGTFFFYLAPPLFQWATVHTPVLSDIDVLQRYESEVHLAIFGILIIVILLARPSGLMGVWTSTKGYFARWPYST